MRGFDTKVFLKRYALRYLPRAHCATGASAGFPCRIGRWLRGPLHEWASATLGSGRLERVGIRSSAASDLFAEHCQRKADHARALWTLLVLSEWLDWVTAETDSRSGETKQQR